MQVGSRRVSRRAHPFAASCIASCMALQIKMPHHERHVHVSCLRGALPVYTRQARRCAPCLAGTRVPRDPTTSSQPRENCIRSREQHRAACSSSALRKAVCFTVSNYWQVYVVACTPWSQQLTACTDGERSQDTSHLLQGQAVPEAHVRVEQICVTQKTDRGRPHKVTQYKAGKASDYAQGKRRYVRKQKGYGGQTKPVFQKKAKSTCGAASSHGRLTLFSDQEGRAASRVHRVQVPLAPGAQALQALRAWWRQEDQGRRAGLLSTPYTFTRFRPDVLPRHQRRATPAALGVLCSAWALVG